MVKHNQTIRRQQLQVCLGMFDLLVDNAEINDHWHTINKMYLSSFFLQIFILFAWTSYCTFFQKSRGWFILKITQTKHVIN